MGSKTLYDEDHRKDGGPSVHSPFATGGEPKGRHASRDGDGCMGSKGGSGSDDEDDDSNPTSTNTAADSLIDHPASATNKKRRRRKPKKKNKTTAAKQSSPPRIPVAELFPNNDYPKGEFQQYVMRYKSESTLGGFGTLNGDQLEDETFLKNYRKAAEIHRQTRHWVQNSVKPGQTLLEIANGIEDSVRALLNNAGIEPGQSLESGMGFPTGLSLNNCVAHYTPNPGQKDVVLQYGDVMKVDFGVQINGWIVDSAFTMTFDPIYDNLLAAVKDATNTGIKNAGIDVRISDVSAAIVEAMESYEVEIGGNVFPVKTVRNLCGHDIKHYHIHGQKTVPLVKNSDQTKMAAGDVFAIETFGTTGRGYTRDDDGIYGYGLSDYAPKRVALPLSSANRLYKTIKENFGTLVFCRRYLDRLKLDRYLAGLNCLVSHGILESYAPLVEIPGSYSAQFEHTILLRESQKEIVSRGEDY